MDEQNPYSAPQSAVADKDESLADLASAQKLAIYAVMGYLLVIGVSIAAPNGIFVGVLGLAVLVIVLIAAGKISRALGAGWFMTILGVIVMLLPLIGLLVLASLNARATKRLKEGGHKVGFLGVKR